MNCSICSSEITSDNKSYTCCGHWGEECEEDHRNICESCVKYDEDELTHHCPDCFDQLYFVCDCCGIKSAIDDYNHMGTCYSGLGCGVENMCHSCYHYDKEVNAVCDKCHKQTTEKKKEETHKEKQIRLIEANKAKEKKLKDLILIQEEELAKKIPGTIRELQQIIRELKEEVREIRLIRESLYNGGVW